jgi:hypothetical protein
MQITLEGHASTAQPRRGKRRIKGYLFGLSLLGLSLAILASAGPQRVMAQTNAPGEQDGDPHSQICQMIEAAARSNGLPVDFFTRVIWQESRLQPDVIGPLTSGGERAQGIAQFMPGTAIERGLYEPFNPVEALPKSGEFLAELRNEFGNLGLAAAAYNAGPQRVRDYLSGARSLPLETRNYVLAVTGHPVEEWAALAIASADAGGKVPAANPAPVSAVASAGAGGKVPTANPVPVNCKDLLVALARAANRYNAQWAGRTFPSWCKGLRHPDVSSCGPVHLPDYALVAPNIIILRGHSFSHDHGHFLSPRSVRAFKSSQR